MGVWGKVINSVFRGVSRRKRGCVAAVCYMDCIWCKMGRWC